MFNSEQCLFDMDTAGEAAQSAIGGDNTVTGNEYRNEVPPAGLADGSRGLGLPDSLSHLKIGARLSERDFAEGLPDLMLEWGAAAHIEGERRHGLPVVKILQYCLFRLVQQRVLLIEQDRGVRKGLRQDGLAPFMRRRGGAKEMEQANPFGTGSNENPAKGRREVMIVELQIRSGLIHLRSP